MNHYQQGVTDPSAVFKNSRPMSVHDLLAELRERDELLSYVARVQTMVSSLVAQNRNQKPSQRMRVMLNRIEEVLATNPGLTRVEQDRQAACRALSSVRRSIRDHMEVIDVEDAPQYHEALEDVLADIERDIEGLIHGRIDP